MTSTKRNHGTHSVPDTACPDDRAKLARLLDLLADLELCRGCHLLAERLAHRAAEMRQVAR